MTIFYADLTWTEMRTAIADGTVVVVPIGATEQHGYHLPLEVDWRLCRTVAEGACRRAQGVGTPVLVTPPIWTGFSPHHMDFPGSITLSSATFTALVRDVARSLWQHGFRKILLLNGHGGNANLLRAAIQQLRFEDGVRAATASYWDFAVKFINEWRESGPGGINHACEMETALMLAVRPELVLMDKATNAAQPPTTPYLGADLALGGPVTIARSFRELTPVGLLGDAARATPERGQALLEAIISEVAAFLSEFHRWPAEPPIAQEPAETGKGAGI